MKRIIGVVFVFALTLVSCSTEKINLSPVSDNITDDLYSASDIGNKTEAITYQSEITNLISSFPRFKNDALNKEIQHLKISLTNYVEAFSDKEKRGINSAYKSYETSYKKVQKLRRYITKDQDDVLNRYLVRIKTNINLLESIN